MRSERQSIEERRSTAGQEGALPGAPARVRIRGGRRPGGRHQAGYLHGGDHALRGLRTPRHRAQPLDGFLRSTAEVNDALTSVP